MTKLRQLGEGWIVSAAYHYYGGYPKMLRRLSFPRATRPMIQRPGHRRQGYWLVEENIKRELQTAFPELLAWEIMPSLHMIQRALPGLGSRILRVDSVVELAIALGLQSYWIGCRHRRRVAGITWSLTFYEEHNRWPHASECPSAVRSERFVRGTSWHDYCRPAKLPRPALLRLIDRCNTVPGSCLTVRTKF